MFIVNTTYIYILLGIHYDLSLVVNLTQDQNRDSPFKAGNITIAMEVNNSTDTQCTNITELYDNHTTEYNCSSNYFAPYYDYSGGGSTTFSGHSGSGENRTTQLSTYKYEYNIEFGDEDGFQSICPGNKSCIALQKYFPHEQLNATIFVEVIKYVFLFGFLPLVHSNNKTIQFIVLGTIELYIN